MFKTFLHTLFFVIAFAMIFSCNSEASQQQSFGYENQHLSHAATQSSPIKSDTIKYHFYRDPNNGLVQSKSPVPVSWTISENTNAEIYIKGPGGMTVGKTHTENYTYSNDPFMLQTARQMGRQIAPVASLEAIVQQYLQPSLQARGYSYVTSYPVPGVVKFWEKFSAGMPQTGSRRQYNAVGTEWADSNGNKAFILVLQSVTTQGAAIQWLLQTTELNAPSDHFESAKNAYLYSVAHTEINPQWQQVMNGKLVSQIRENDAFWAAKTRESAQAHQQRMAAINARGNAARSVGSTYSDILDISHAGYLNRSAMNSAGHTKTVNVTAGHAIISNSGTGERYTVESGNRYYWVNNDGVYIGTDNAVYDPRIDNKINDQQWTKFEVEN